MTENAQEELLNCWGGRVKRAKPWIGKGSKKEGGLEIPRIAEELPNHQETRPSAERSMDPPYEKEDPKLKRLYQEKETGNEKLYGWTKAAGGRPS